MDGTKRGRKSIMGVIKPVTTVSKWNSLWLGTSGRRVQHTCPRRGAREPGVTLQLLSAVGTAPLQPALGLVALLPTGKPRAEARGRAAGLVAGTACAPRVGRRTAASAPAGCAHARVRARGQTRVQWRGCGSAPARAGKGARARGRTWQRARLVLAAWGREGRGVGRRLNLQPVSGPWASVSPPVPGRAGPSRGPHPKCSASCPLQDEVGRQLDAAEDKHWSPYPSAEVRAADTALPGGGESPRGGTWFEAHACLSVQSLWFRTYHHWISSE